MHVQKKKCNLSAHTPMMQPPHSQMCRSITYYFPPPDKQGCDVLWCAFLPTHNLPGPQSKCVYRNTTLSLWQIGMLRLSTTPLCTSTRHSLRQTLKSIFVLCPRKEYCVVVLVWSVYNRGKVSLTLVVRLSAQPFRFHVSSSQTVFFFCMFFFLFRLLTVYLSTFDAFSENKVELVNHFYSKSN